MTTRSKRAAVAQETMLILMEGRYTTPNRATVSIGEALQSSVERSKLYSPTRLRQAVKAAWARPHQTRPTMFEVANETTLAAARRLLVSGRERVLALNFASARNPGGGFLNGSQAQEESLARASGLYASLTRHMEMYEANRRFSSCLYTDHMIYSPDVPVFRDDDDALLEQPYLLSFVTAPAVNAGVVRAREAEAADRIAEVMLARIEMLLALAVEHQHESLVLGAWGCGVFANDPEQVAGWFAQHLTGDGRFRGAFRDVVFAVWDRTKDLAAFTPFARRFASAQP